MDLERLATVSRQQFADAEDQSKIVIQHLKAAAGLDVAARKPQLRNEQLSMTHSQLKTHKKHFADICTTPNIIFCAAIHKT